MTREEEQQLFAQLCRYRPFKDWLAYQMQEQVKVLLVGQDVELMRRAQGAAAVIKQMQDKLAAAETSDKRGG